MSGILNLIATGIYSKLTSDSTLKSLLAGDTSVYSILAPKDAAYPYIVYSLQFGGPENINPSDIQNHLYFIRAYATTARVSGNIHAQIASLLHKQTITVSGFTNISLELEEELEGADPESSGLPVFMRGGFYRSMLDS